nr:YadA-like family protein [Paraburkholderia solitsugae]
MALGYGSNASANSSFAAGDTANASGVGAIALGALTSASGASAVALGTSSVASQQNAMALGVSTTASATGAVALGANSVADRANTVSVGSTTATRQIVNVAQGTQTTDAVNLGQLQQLGIKTDSSGNAINSFVAYDDTTQGKVTLAGASGTTLSNVAAGVAATDAVNVSQLQSEDKKIDAAGENTATALGGGAAYSATTGAISAPTYNVAGGTQHDVGTALSSLDSATVQFSGAGGAADVKGKKIVNVAAGELTATSSDAVNGSQLYTTNRKVDQNSDAIALNSEAIEKNDKAITDVAGSVNDITNQLNNGELGLVQQDQTSRDLMVASDKDGAHVNFEGTAGARELIGVAAGTTSNSAVNVGQLSPVVASLGGGAQVNADGSVTGPTYHMQGGTQNTVGGALDTLDNGLSSLQTQINNGSIGMVTQDQTSRDILVGAATDGLRVNMSGTAGNRVVTGVAAGAIGAQSSDAVNGSQLYATAASTASALGGGSTVNADGTVSVPTYSVGGTTVNNVGAAITNIDGRVTQNTSDIASLQTTVGTMSGSVANAMQYDTAAHDKVTLGGSANAPKVTLTNLQDGELSATSSDAVTGAQLWNTNQQVANLNQAVQNQQSTGSSSLAIDTGGPAASATGSGSMAMGGGAQASGDNSVALGAGSVADQANTVSVGSPGNERRITNVADGQGPTDAVNMRQFQSGVNSVARSAYSGVAAATALTMIPEVDQGKTLAVGIAGGSYKGYQAVALGASARITANLKVKVGAGISAADTTYGAGASYQW